MWAHPAKLQCRGRHPDMCPSYQDGKDREFGVWKYSHLWVGQGKCVWKDLGILFEGIFNVMQSQTQGKPA